MLKNNKERVFAICKKAKLFENIFFRGGHFNGKIFDENVFNDAKHVINLALGTARGLVEQDKLSIFFYKLIKKLIWKKIILEELRKSITKMDQNKGFDRYNWHPFQVFCQLFSSFKFFTLNLFLYLLNICLEVSWWPFKQVSVALLKKTGKAASSPSGYRCITLASQESKMLERILDDRINRLD